MTSDKRTAPKGILGFPVAPYTTDGQLDEAALATNIGFLIEEGLSSIFIACGSGEFHALNADEYERMVKVAVEVADGQVPVYTGVGGNISHAVDLVQRSEQLGADGYLVLPPYLIEGEQQGLYEYYQAIIEESNLNAILYQRGNAILKRPTLERLVDAYPQIVGLKDGYGDMELNLELVHSLGDRLNWLNGMPFAEITMEAYAGIGFNSYSSAISNYIPHISRLFYHALQEGDKQTLHDIYTDVLLPINRIRKARKGYAVALIKAGMDIMGLPVNNSVRPPVVSVEAEHYRQLEGVLTSALQKYPREIQPSQS
ncbi:5-dehydro-4-deoxyglucarate dehydratase [Caldalkalibacillus salinus]|uniref:5-dehydro-4-deoxyglucarate dehydratase n=1 Tax=Caldalkalibacillus salinus TaxID=2803787 RepID=UPI0019228316|nr:5-dehydro-4-deoxyglucarate dehydratase [Caldalkalibacillus salinus]